MSFCGKNNQFNTTAMVFTRLGGGGGGGGGVLVAFWVIKDPAFVSKLDACC